MVWVAGNTELAAAAWVAGNTGIAAAAWVAGNAGLADVAWVAGNTGYWLAAVVLVVEPASDWPAAQLTGTAGN